MKNIVIQRKRFALLCMSAALIFASSPSSVFAAEENAQTESAPAGAPSTEAPSVQPSNPNEAPGPRHPNRIIPAQTHPRT